MSASALIALSLGVVSVVASLVTFAFKLGRKVENVIARLDKIDRLGSQPVQEAVELARHNVFQTATVERQLNAVHDQVEAIDEKVTNGDAAGEEH